ncbi:MAG TPA: tetratricopeptide repeat protein [Candidatus Acidoferrales bacterium]|nr:tetratricopeptide repeat protein [Candidatus Acidoferrales bacterium]
MFRLAAFVVSLASCCAQPVYELWGQIVPEGTASVTLFGATHPFTTSTLTGESGRFTIKKLEPASYTISVFLPGQGEARQTIEVGPGSADARRRVHLTLRLHDADFDRTALERQHAVSRRQLTIPDKAFREYADAQRDLEKHDTAAAEKHLERAVELAPQFSVAWNNLGTIAYQTERFPLAERRFREALKQDPAAYEPLVNLGGVLINLRQFDEALEVNVHATLVRPNDALAHSQLGMAYFEIGRFDDAVTHLERAREIDPAHFSHPQLYLAEIHLRRGEKNAAADAMEDFLSHHPDYPQAEAMRRKIAELRQ